MAQETVICTRVPYEWNWSQDVEKCALDLVLSSFTHINAVQAIAVASKGCWFFLQDPLLVSLELKTPIRAPGL